jgi:hypothetical protein
VKVTGWPVKGAAGLKVKSATRGCGAMVTVSEPLAETPLASVTVKVTVYVPLTGKLADREPVPVYGAVPPVAETVQLNGLPAVRPVFGQSTIATNGCGAIVTLSEPLALTAFASVTVKDTVYVPLTGKLADLEPVPVYGPVPPEAETLQLNGLPAVRPELGQSTETTSG